MEINKIEDTFYRATLPNKNELIVNAHRLDGVLIHGRAMWLSFSENSNILVKIEVIGIDKSIKIETPFGTMPAYLTLEEYEFPMSVSQYFGLIQKFYKHRPDSVGMIINNAI